MTQPPQTGLLDTPLGPIPGPWGVVHADEVTIARAISEGAPLAILASDEAASVLIEFRTAERALAIGLALAAEARIQLGLDKPLAPPQPPRMTGHLQLVPHPDDAASNLHLVADAVWDGQE